MLKKSNKYLILDGDISSFFKDLSISTETKGCVITFILNRKAEPPKDPKIRKIAEHFRSVFEKRNGGKTC